MVQQRDRGGGAMREKRIGQLIISLNFGVQVKKEGCCKK